MKSHGNRRLHWSRVGLLALVMLGFLSGTQARASSNDEYNFSWLDPDKKIYVLQNRKYTKAGRALLSGMVNTSIAQPYRNSYGIDLRAAYYFSEAWGVEAFYGLFSNSPNS